MYNRYSYTTKTKAVLLLIPLFVMFIIPSSSVMAEEKGELSTILEKTGDYCERLKTAVFHFFCRETVHETVEKTFKYPEKRRGLKNFLEGNLQSKEDSRYEVLNNIRKTRIRNNYSSKRSLKKNSALHHYQIIQQNGAIRERRDRVDTPDKNNTGKKRASGTFLYSYQNAITPINIFAPENQSKYSFSLAGKKKIMGRKAYIIEVSPAGMVREAGKEERKLVTAWIDRQDFSVIRIQVYPMAIKGYDNLLKLDKDKMANLDIYDTHIFGFLRDGIRYPTKTKIKLSFDSEPQKVVSNTTGGHNQRVKFGAVITTKISTEIIYKKYMFFDVKVDDPVFRD